MEPMATCSAFAGSPACWDQEASELGHCSTFHGQTSPVELQSHLLAWGGEFPFLLAAGLERKIFIFPEASNTAPAVLRTALQQPLTSFTVCLRSYTDLNRAYSLFSYTSGKSDNEFTIFKPKPDQYSLFVGGSIVTFSVVDYLNSKPHWENICMSWESATGISRVGN
uniref:Uncharacterized protein n=1 Tax=Sphaerodactylus townsendi TaxID=933632 RepID=A0ACB8G7I5_9SAUR